jgi:hypothetical protein
VPSWLRWQMQARWRKRERRSKLPVCNDPAEDASSGLDMQDGGQRARAAGMYV